MYGMVNNNGTNRLPRAERAAEASSSSSTLGKTVGTALVQAACVVLVAKVVDVVFEALANRRRERQQAQAPQRGRREETVGV